MRPLVAIAVALPLAACAHRVRLSSTPPGADVRLDGRWVGVTPMEVVTRWRPGRLPRLEVALAGYRAVEVPLGRTVGPVRIAADALLLRWGRLSGRTPRADVEVLLVPRHGPAGTWTPEDVP